MPKMLKAAVNLGAIAKHVLWASVKYPSPVILLTTKRCKGTRGRRCDTFETDPPLLCCPGSRKSDNRQKRHPFELLCGAVMGAYHVLCRLSPIGPASHCIFYQGHFFICTDHPRLGKREFSAIQIPAVTIGPLCILIKGLHTTRTLKSLPLRGATSSDTQPCIWQHHSHNSPT